MGFLSALAVYTVGGIVIYGTGGLGAGMVASWIGIGQVGIGAGTVAAAAQAYAGDLAAGSILSQLTSIAMAAPTP